jgi:hypothetical protein
MSIMLVPLSTVKSFLDIDTEKTDYDSLLVTIIKYVSSRFETFLNRKLQKQERTQYFEAGRSKYFLEAFPVDSSASITVVLDDDTQTINDDYWLWPELGIIHFDSATSYIEPRELYVTYTGGYAATDTSVGITGISTITETVLLGVPDDVSFACLLQTAFVFRRRKDIGLSSVSMPDGAINTIFAADLLPEVKKILLNYRKVPTDY